ncbi:MAG TPA: OmpA family protein [Thermoanaerobaculia bacterium]|nr:OmpA family protein [Thermoanaerobaculia bacterium]
MRTKTLLIMVLTIAAAVAAPAQKQTPQQALAQGQLNMLTQAQQALQAAEQAGAQATATSLYEDAAYRLRFAQENWNAGKDAVREAARLRAEEALWASRAALAKARWIGTNNAIASLTSDIRRMGGNNDLTLPDEPAALVFARGADSAARIKYAQAIIDDAKRIGATSVVGNELKPAQQNLDTARQIVKNDKQSDAADHLAYDAEMMARRAIYLKRFSEADQYVPNLQITRTRLAQAESERQAAAERLSREAAERQAADLQRQLAAEQANRQAQAAEVDRLRAQVDESNRAIAARIEADRVARMSAERSLDEAMSRYESALSSGNTSDVETLRRQVEDQTLTLRAIQERERLNEQTMSAEIEGLRTDLANSQSNIDAAVRAQRQADLERRQQELEQLRKDREADLARRAEVDRQQQAALSEATRRRQEAESQAQAMQQQVQAAQAAAQSAQQSAQQSAADLERTRQQLSDTQQQLGQRDAEARRLQMQNELSKIASTRSDTRGLIVTLASSLFDTGKSTLKPGAKSTLTKIAKQLETNPDLHIAVEGHTDNVGTSASNQTLSEKRANAVRDYLVAQGVPSDRVTATGRGEDAPVASNKTAAGRQQNRRVELIITQ